MNRSMSSTRMLVVLLAPVLGLVIGVSARADVGEGYGMGPGMMGGPGYGMHQGMGSACHPGAMMGPGMMMGQGMMGPGMGGYGMRHMAMLDLSDEQRQQLFKRSDQLRKQHWEAMGEMMDKQAKLRDLLASDKPDPEAVGEAYLDMAKVRRRMVEDCVKAGNAMQEVLTDEQRQELRQWRRGSAMGPGARRGMGPGMGRHMMDQ